MSLSHGEYCEFLASRVGLKGKENGLGVPGGCFPKAVGEKFVVKAPSGCAQCRVRDRR